MNNNSPSITPRYLNKVIQDKFEYIKPKIKKILETSIENLPNHREVYKKRVEIYHYYTSPPFSRNFYIQTPLVPMMRMTEKIDPTVKNFNPHSYNEMTKIIQNAGEDKELQEFIIKIAREVNNTLNYTFEKESTICGDKMKLIAEWDQHGRRNR